jgi:hypothetical protein
MKVRKTRTLKTGHMYMIEWDDHFSADKVLASNPVTDAPALYRTIGKLVKVTPKLVQLEQTRRTEVDDTGDYSHSIFGILKSCITSAYDLGIDPTDPKRRSQTRKKRSR